MLQLEIINGSSADWPLQATNRGGLTNPAYASGDTLTAMIWSGDDQAVLCSPATAWYTANGTQTGFDQGQVLVSISSVQSALLVPGGTYSIQVWWTSANASKTACIVRGTISVLPTSGVAASPPVYCTLSDMEVECNWIGQYYSPDIEQSAFAKQRGAARTWMDSLILKAAPVTGMGQLISRQAWWSWGYSGVDPRCGTGLAVDRVLMGYLALNNLMLNTPQGQAVVRACACYAITLVLRSQMGSGLSMLALYYMRRAQSEASNIIAEIDINADGRPEYAIALSCTNTRYA